MQGIEVDKVRLGDVRAEAVRGHDRPHLPNPDSAIVLGSNEDDITGIRELMAPRTHCAQRIPSSVPDHYEPCSGRVRVCKLKKCWQLERVKSASEMSTPKQCDATIGRTCFG